MVSEIQWKPFWLATQLYPQNDWPDGSACEVWCIQHRPHSAYRWQRLAHIDPGVICVPFSLVWRKTVDIFFLKIPSSPTVHYLRRFLSTAFQSLYCSLSQVLVRNQELEKEKAHDLWSALHFTKKWLAFVQQKLKLLYYGQEAKAWHNFCYEPIPEEGCNRAAKRCAQKSSEIVSGWWAGNF